MEKILLIHTVLPRAVIALSNDGTISDTISNEGKKDHGAILHPAIDTILRKNDLEPADLAAVAVTTGPGSYTGIRVGLSAAKGLSFALQIPVIPISTLELLAASAIDTHNKEGIYIPLIQARHSEYFAGWYDKDGVTLQEDAIIDLDDLERNANNGNDQFYFGPGITPGLLSRKGFEFLSVNEISTRSFGRLAFEKWKSGQILCAAEVVPSYLKAAYTTRPKAI